MKTKKKPSIGALRVAYKYWIKNSFDEILSQSEDSVSIYNSVPVHWCSNCGSLSIVECSTFLDPSITSCCSKCYSTKSEVGSIDDWLSLSNKQNK